MANEFRKFDAHGFPVPPRFDELKFRDDAPPHRQISLRTKRAVILVVCGLAALVVFGPQIYSAAQIGVSHWFRSRAVEKIEEGNYTGAINDLSRAIDWSRHSRRLYYLRAICREKVDDLNGSLADWSQAIGMTTSSQELADFHSSRSFVYVRLGRHSEAIDDATQAVNLSPTAENLNTRAYVRALANTQLPDALVDINKALAQMGENNAEFLDTRGYILHLLDRNDEALKDLSRAIAMMQRTKLMVQMKQQFIDQPETEEQLRETDHNLAVMYHHRGLVNEKLGNNKDAAEDLSNGNHLGYDPAQGVM
jgi:tetratricopeptide (TPR) repeat protein